MEDLTCEFCDRIMTEEEHDFCDICGECREHHSRN
jgi:rRNA maturation endonuclease Nob1